MKRQQRIIETSWARGYARVLYELKVPAEDIEETRNLFAQTPELLEVLTNPTIFIAKKEKIIDRIFPSSIRNFLKVVCRYEKMNRIGEIFEAYDSYCRQQKRILQAQLTCVEPPDEQRLEEIRQFLCRKYGADEAQVEIQRDPGLFGGFILHVGSDEYDWSLKGRLQRMQEQLTWR